MEFFLQQEGNLGVALLIVALLILLLYLVMPIFIWRIWYWSRQSNKNLETISNKLELLIREIAPAALPVEPTLAGPTAATAEEDTPETETSEVSTAAPLSLGSNLSQDTEEESDDSFLFENDFEGELADESDMEFSIGDAFEDMSEELAEAELSDFTEGEEELSEQEEMVSRQDDADEQDELMMDFEEAESFFDEEEPEGPAEIPITEESEDDFTIEHFDSNEEKSFAFEHVDDTAEIDDELASASEETIEEELSSETVPDDTFTFDQDEVAADPDEEEQEEESSADTFSLDRDEQEADLTETEVEMPEPEEQPEKSAADDVPDIMSDDIWKETETESIWEGESETDAESFEEEEAEEFNFDSPADQTAEADEADQTATTDGLTPPDSAVTETATEEEGATGEESEIAADTGTEEARAEEEEENVGDVASSYLSDLTSKLNLDAFQTKPASEPKAPPEPIQEKGTVPAPTPEPKPEPEDENPTTLFARCEGCGHKLAYKQTLSGKRVRCPACRTAFTLP